MSEVELVNAIGNQLGPLVTCQVGITWPHKALELIKWVDCNASDFCEQGNTIIHENGSGFVVRSVVRTKRGSDVLSSASYHVVLIVLGKAVILSSLGTDRGIITRALAINVTNIMNLQELESVSFYHGTSIYTRGKDGYELKSRIDLN